MSALTPKISFANNRPDFIAELRKKVNEYFEANNIKRTGNVRLYTKTAVLVTVALSIYLVLVLVPVPVWLALVLCALEGVTFAAIGFNVMHDGAHGSYSSKKWVNRIMGYSLNVMGGNVDIWKQKHNVIHHSFTNIEGVDDDIDIKPFMRTNTNQPKYKIHRYQHIYWSFLYGLTYLAWVFLQDFQKYFARRIASVPIKKMSLRKHIMFWASKVAYVLVFIVVPAFTWGILGAILGYLVFAFVCGLVIAVVFQLAHVVEGASFPETGPEDTHIENNWAVHQLETTANFSTRSKFVFWLTGGLNYQVEHHLFPKISHIHYPEVSKIVKDVCRKFQVTYLEYPSVGSAIRAHVSYLKSLG